LLQRALGVALGSATLAGDIAIGLDEKEWRFTPRQPCPAGRYDLVVLSILEDGMGNRIVRPFDIDTFDRIDRSALPDKVTIRFQVN
jgi:hypothetical protein